MAQCRSCGATIIWTVTESGRKMPIDNRPSAKGQWRIETQHGLITAIHDPQSQEPLYQSHFATCPDADAHRRPRRAAE